MIAETFSAERAYIYLVDNDNKTITRYTETGETKIYPIDAGLIGLGIRARELLSISDAYKHESFNGMIDIDTSMPVLIKPIMSDKMMTNFE